MTDCVKDRVTGAALELILRKYLVDHSSRRLNYLYWNLTDPKHMTLNFVNLSGKELNRVNNSDLVFRIVKVRKADEWSVIEDFILTHIVIEPKAVYVIRVDYLISYLKGIKNDPEAFQLDRRAFGTAYSVTEDPTKSKPICTIDNDIQSLFLIDSLYTKYRKVMTTEVGNCTVTDITDDYLNDSGFKYVVKDLNVVIPVTDSVDAISRKFIRAMKEKDPNSKLEQLYLCNGMSTVVSRFTCPDILSITVRVYMQIFLKKYSKKRK